MKAKHCIGIWSSMYKVHHFGLFTRLETTSRDQSFPRCTLRAKYHVDLATSKVFFEGGFGGKDYLSGSGSRSSIGRRGCH